MSYSLTDKYVTYDLLIQQQNMHNKPTRIIEYNCASICCDTKCCILIFPWVNEDGYKDKNNVRVYIVTVMNYGLPFRLHQSHIINHIYVLKDSKVCI